MLALRLCPCHVHSSMCGGANHWRVQARAEYGRTRRTCVGVRSHLLRTFLNSRIASQLSGPMVQQFRPASRAGPTATVRLAAPTTRVVPGKLREKNVTDKPIDPSAHGNGVPLALARVTARAKRRLTVSSPTIRGGIPARHSEYADGVSPEITVEPVWPTRRAYALILEDPDAKSDPAVRALGGLEYSRRTRLRLPEGPAGTGSDSSPRAPCRENQPRFGGILRPASPGRRSTSSLSLPGCSRSTLSSTCPPGAERDAAAGGHGRPRARGRRTRWHLSAGCRTTEVILRKKTAACIG